MTHICSVSSRNKRFSLRPICGNCLERIGIRNIGGGYAVIDKCTNIRVGDIVFCTKVTGQINGYLKQVKEFVDDDIIVGTAYLDETKDFQFKAAEVIGVVIKTFDKTFGKQEYVRPSYVSPNALREYKIFSEEDTYKMLDSVAETIENIGEDLKYFLNNHQTDDTVHIPKSVIENILHSIDTVSQPD